MPTCKNCNQPFTIYPEDTELYQRLGVAEPTWCPPCREMRRLIFRNTKTLYPRQCDRCHKNVISVYPVKTEYVVYCPECWYGDAWDGRDYAVDYDWSRTFFDQFGALMKAVPRISSYNRNSVNCDYSNAIVDSKNCYLLFSSRAEDCYFGYKVIDSQDCVDNLGLNNCQLCYQCTDSARCFNVAYSRYALDCRDAVFLFNCSGCHDCFMCANLKNKEYHWLNQPLSKAEYDRRLAEWRAGSYQAVQQFQRQFDELNQTTIRLFSQQKNCTNCSGDNLRDSKNCFHCFDMVGGNGNRYSADSAVNTKDIMDSSVGSLDNELIYEVLSTITGYRVMFGTYCWACNFCQYCDHLLLGGSYCFGCSGIKNGKYAILNKEYEEAEYTRLVQKIIGQMKRDGEWGEFFPVSLSPFAYNESAAQDYFPSTKEAVMTKGWCWQDTLPGVFGQETMSAQNLPDKISAVTADILKETIACLDCGRNYKIIALELTFYQKQNLALPRHCPDCRFGQRLAQRNPHRLWTRQCRCEQAGHQHNGRCSVQCETAYPLESQAIIYCEECYQKEIY
ncbi:hypothetical protein HY933_02725 [Candidatus Falkowbacteria bacterium]|nr:hypothetical protein [Candidatus Falkowbacteria bacterium]